MRSLTSFYVHSTTCIVGVQKGNITTQRGVDGLIEGESAGGAKSELLGTGGLVTARPGEHL
jgi:hypothetical protein